jgi:hypothetical protein
VVPGTSSNTSANKAKPSSTRRRERATLAITAEPQPLDAGNPTTCRGGCVAVRLGPSTLQTGPGAGLRSGTSTTSGLDR